MGISLKKTQVSLNINGISLLSLKYQDFKYGDLKQIWESSKTGPKQKAKKYHWKLWSWLGSIVRAKDVCGQVKRNETTGVSKSQTLNGFTKEHIQKNPLEGFHPENYMINLETEVKNMTQSAV